MEKCNFSQLLQQNFRLGSGENFHLAQISEGAVFNGHKASGKDLSNAKISMF